MALYRVTDPRCQSGWVAHLTPCSVHGALTACYSDPANVQAGFFDITIPDWDIDPATGDQIACNISGDYRWTVHRP